MDQRAPGSARLARRMTSASLQGGGHFIPFARSGRTRGSNPGPHYLRFGRQIAHHCHHLRHRPEHKLRAPLRHRHLIKVAERKPFAGPPEKKLIGGHGEVLRIVPLLHDNVWPAAIPWHNFIGLPPRREAGQPNIQETVRDTAEINIHKPSVVCGWSESVPPTFCTSHSELCT